MIPLDRQLPPAPQMRLRLGVIVGTPAGGTCTVDVGGTEVAGVPYLIAPSASDTVHVIQDGPVLLVLGPQT